jgi:8-hydroxy-5-deazaflavin:NADPH oxidoreductase
MRPEEVMGADSHRAGGRPRRLAGVRNGGGANPIVRFAACPLRGQYRRHRPRDEELEVKIAVLGTGIVGRTLAGGAARSGHDVVVGTRDPQATLARTEGDAMGNPPYSAWQEEHPDIALLPFPEAAERSELVINATSGEGAVEAVRLAGAERLAGKVLVDVSNPLDFSAGFPPHVTVDDTGSLAEQLQAGAPDARVVKTLNTVTAALMVDPGALGGGDHTIFLSGDDAEAKATAAELLRGFGWRDVVDLGDLSTARGTELLIPLWLRLMGALGAPAFNFKVVR